MKAAFVESLNGYMARGATDNMMWTPILDKQIFKLITTISGVCVCSRHTYNLLPQKMLSDPARKFIVAEKVGNKSLPALNILYPNAFLIGGPTFLKKAYDMSVIDTMIITTVDTIIEPQQKYKNPFAGNLRAPTSTINFENMTIRIYKTQRGKEK